MISRAWVLAHRGAISITLAVLIALPSYLVAANTYWVGDDYNYVVPKTWAAVIHFFDPRGRAVFRPLAWTTFAIDWTLFGDQPLGWHLTGFLLHGLNAVAAGLLVRAITRRGDIALVAALLFALHPSAPETVTWVGSRPDASFAGPWLLALWLWVRWRQGAGRGTWALAVVCGFLSILGKEAAVTLPLVSLWIDVLFGRGWARWPGRRDANWWRNAHTWLLVLRDHLPFILISGLYVALRGYLFLTGQGRLDYGLTEHLSFLQRAPDVLAGYFLIAPGLWWLPQPILAWPLAVKIGIIVAGLLTTGLLVRWLGRMALFAVGWVPITLLLTTQGVTNRWFYVPSLGVCLLVALIWARLWDKVTRPSPQPAANPQPPTSNPLLRRALALAPLVVTILAWATLTAAHNREWVESGETARGIQAQIAALQPDPPRPATFYVANPPYSYKSVDLFNSGFKAAVNLIYHDWTTIKSYDLVEDKAQVQAALADPTLVGPHPVFLRYEAGRVVLYPSLAALVAAGPTQ